MPETVKRTARVPILGENGRISDDYIPAAIGENVEKAESAKTSAETAQKGAEAAKTGADKAQDAAETAQKGAESAKTSAETAQKGAEAAKTGADKAKADAEKAKADAEKAKADAESAGTAASNSATAAAESAASVADKFISSAQATTLEPGSQATASVGDQVLTIGVPKGDKGDKGDPGQDGANGTDGVTPFTQAAVTTLEPGAPATVTIEDNTLKLGIPKGETGDKGDPGTAATIAVGSVTGLDAGASPTVVNSGTANAARFDFGIPKGDKGDKGDPGHTPQRGVDYWTAEDVEAVVEDAKAQAVVELAEIGNVPKRTVTDLVAHGEDAYAQKPIEVRVKGRTVKNLWPQLSTTTTTNGVTFSCDDTGLFTVSGTATARASFRAEVEGTKVGAKYTGIATKVKNVKLDVYTYTENSYTGGVVSITGSTATTGTIPDDGHDAVYAYIIVEAGETANASFRVMLVEGSEAPDCFTPPASITSVQAGNLVTAGKNLFKSDGMTHSSSNDVSDYMHLPSGTYTFSASGGPFGQIIIESVDNVYSSDNFMMSKATFTLPYSDEIRVRTWISDSDSVFTFDPQIELGSTATAYEPPNITTTPLPEVELRSLPDGTCDELVINADGTCEVERRTKLVDGEVAALDTPTTEPQSPVTLPVLPAPTFNQYRDGDIPSDTSTTYTRDINIALANLEAQIADLVTKEAANV